MKALGPGYGGTYKTEADALSFIIGRGFKLVESGPTAGEYRGTWNDAGARAYMHRAKVWVPVSGGKERRVTRIIVTFGA